MYTDYFIDTENVNSDYLNDINDLDKSDNIYFFYSQKSHKISYKLLEKVREAKCKFFFIESTVTAPNALDFELIAFLGIKIGSYKKKINKHTYIIVSNDKGYESSINYMKSKEINILRRNQLFTNKEENKTVSTKEQENKTVSTKELENKTISTKELENNFGLGDKYNGIIKQAIIKSKDLQSLHTYLVKHENPVIKKYYQEIYKDLKPKFKTLKKSLVK